MDTFFLVLLVFLAILAAVDLFVGVSNDAVNFLNSAVGSRIAPFKVVLGVAAVGVLLGATFSGGMMEIARSGVFHPSMFSFSDVIAIYFAVESIYGKLKDAGSLIPKKMVAKAAFGGNLRIICSGGAYLDPDYVDKFKEYGITILQGYGMTECSPVISTNLEWENKKGSVGKLLPNCEAKVVDEEIWVRGSSVMQGYYKMPEQTAETLEDGWLKTGDLGYVDEDDFVYITGRRKNLIILANGENVSPEELENQLSRSALVKEILVREKDKVIEAEIFPDYEYAKKKHVKDIFLSTAITFTSSVSS